MLTELQKIGLVYEAWAKRFRYNISPEVLRQIGFMSDISQAPDVAPWGFWVYDNLFLPVTNKGHLIYLNKLEQLDPEYEKIRYKWNDDGFNDYDLMSEIGWVRVSVHQTNLYFNASRADYVSRQSLSTIKDLATLYDKEVEFSQY